MSGKCHRKCPESIHVVQKISGKCPVKVKWSNLLSGILCAEKTGQIPDIKEFWTNSG
jgi:hypothetical protein